MDYLIIITLIAEVLFLSRVDRKVFGTWLTPFNLLGYPYMVVAVTAFLFAPSFDFAPLYAPSVLIWIVGLFIFWVGGFFLGWGIFGLSGGPPKGICNAFSAVPMSETEPLSVKW